MGADDAEAEVWRRGCLINTFEVSAPSEVPVLAYISEASPAVVGVLYNDHDDADVRDAVTLTNTIAEHSKVRDRRSTKIPKSLSRQIPEGWNTFTLVVAGGNLTIKLVLSEEDHVDLYTLVLKDTVRKMHVEGNVSSCHQVSPEWHVKVGKEVTLLLQPKDRCLDQWVKVSPRGSAAPYVTFPTSRNTKTPIPADTTLRVAISLRGTHALLRLFRMVVVVVMMVVVVVMMMVMVVVVVVVMMVVVVVVMW
ncbi:hypothetical protein GWK47_025799 [Chionoecetes opilio]|uniref:Uncharacterized protein n=1 Tax=Chionoecetes opilio TaxID=41210 RepID=A0A8J8WN15_CHIOP|nr:hypothetical protein GWK47_025799 [Chionoecetes opilio]